MAFANAPHVIATFLTSLPGMNVAAGPELAAAVTNAGGLGVIGGVGYTPNVLRQQVRSLLFPLTNVPIHGRKPDT
jgi:Nitronate monooxygenase